MIFAIINITICNFIFGDNTPLYGWVFVKESRVICEKMATESAALVEAASQGLKSGDDTKAALAIYQLGVKRSWLSIDFLVSNFLFQPKSPFNVSRSWTLSEARPCVAALGRIGGQACHDPVLKRLAKHATADDIKYTGIVFILALGHDDAIAVLKARADREKDAVLAKRIQAVADWVAAADRKLVYE